MPKHFALLCPFVIMTSLSMVAPGIANAQDCAATPEDAWRLARAAVATKDAGKVMARLSPSYQTQNSIETAVGASMVAEISGLAGDMSNKPELAKKAKDEEKKLLAELDTILKKHKAMTIKEIGTPRLPRMQAPDVIARFSKIDHAAFAREMMTFFGKVEAAAKAAGVSGSGEPPKLDELVVGYGDLNASLADLKTTGDTATAKSGKVTMRFTRINGCWLVDGRD
jgi:hypothetical protein